MYSYVLLHAIFICDANALMWLQKRYYQGTDFLNGFMAKTWEINSFSGICAGSTVWIAECKNYKRSA